MAMIDLLVQDDLKVKIRFDLMDDEDLSSIWIELTGRGAKKITLGCIYREFKLL